MGNSMTETMKFPSGVCGDALTEVLRAGAQRLLRCRIPDWGAIGVSPSYEPRPPLVKEI